MGAAVGRRDRLAAPRNDHRLMLSDSVLDRITYTPANREIKSIPFPSGLAPEWVAVNAKDTDPLPHANVVIMTFTSAEKYALADALTPGHHYTTWQPYTEHWDEYEPHLTGRSPAREAKNLGSYALVTIGKTRALLIGSELHPSTDDVTMPLRKLWRQIIMETGCTTAISTGTAGGVGPDVVEGDVLITASVQLNYTKLFKDEPFAHERFVGGEAYELTQGLTHRLLEAQDKLIPVNAGKLAPVATRLPVIRSGGYDCQSVDYFAFAAPGDPYGILTADPSTGMEEMDEGALVLACQDLGDKAPVWLSIRCASDPEVKAGTLKQEKAEAERIYEHDGYTAAIGSILACWATVADR